MHGISLLPVMRGETDTVREVAIAGYYGMSWSLITKDWSYIHWLKNDIDTDEMNRLFYDGSGKGGNAGRAVRRTGDERGNVDVRSGGRSDGARAGRTL